MYTEEKIYSFKKNLQEQIEKEGLEELRFVLFDEDSNIPWAIHFFSREDKFIINRRDERTYIIGVEEIFTDFEEAKVELISYMKAYVRYNQSSVKSGFSGDYPCSLWDKSENVLNDKILDEIKNLNLKFDDKIATDAHKAQLFDNMHKELVSYQNGVVEKMVEVMALDLIQLYDSIAKLTDRHSKMEASQENYDKLLKNVKFISQDIEDILYRHNIEAYDTLGDDVDTKTQKIIQIIDTEDEKLHNKVAEKTARGFRKENKVLRPERIKIYKYKK